MKKKIFSLLVALVATVAVQAQTISVVSPSGATSLYRTLPEAIKGAANGSVVYLPGGGFTIPDSVKITKKLTIIGIGSKANSDNVDGATTINGKLYFNQGSDGSAVMGCHIADYVYIGYNGQVNDVMINRCHTRSIYVKTWTCTGTVISQNYCYGSISFGSSSSSSTERAGGTVKNNIITGGVSCMTSGIISNNIFCNSSASSTVLVYLATTTVTGNIIYRGAIEYSSSIFAFGNARFNMEWGENPIKFSTESLGDVFKNPASSSGTIAYDFHFKDEYKQYESQVGIYAGEGFDDSQLAPTPRIVAKHIPDKTDAEGKLNIKVRVKASE